MATAEPSAPPTAAPIALTTLASNAAPTAGGDRKPVVATPRANAADSNKPTNGRSTSPRKAYASDTDSDDGGRGSDPKRLKKKRKNKKINRQHPEFELTYDMMLGIRTTVGMVESKPVRDLTEADFQDAVRLRMPSDGSSITPAHTMRDFKFKDYSPEVFRHLRMRFGIKPADYLVNVCGNFQFLEFIANSKSGQFFFYTHDRQFMIKTVTQQEEKFLRNILPHYYYHVMNNPNTLLTRIYGMHRVKPHKKREVHFLIFGSVFYNSKYIHKTYDIKGSTFNRAATAEERARPNPVLKDNDFLADHQKLRLGPQKGKVFKEQLEKDVGFLRKLNIMDFSLLLGIHHLDRPIPRRARHGDNTDENVDESVMHGDEEDADGPSRRNTVSENVGGPLPPKNPPSLGSASSAKPVTAAAPASITIPSHPGAPVEPFRVVIDPVKTKEGDEKRPPQDGVAPDSQRLRRETSNDAELRRQSNYGLPSNYNKFSKPDDIQFVAPDFGPAAIPERKDIADHSKGGIKVVQSVFTMDHGGCRAEDANGNLLQEIYYMGIIDILTVYSIKKRVEHFGKSLTTDGKTISAVPAADYALRFKAFLSLAVD